MIEGPEIYAATTPEVSAKNRSKNANFTIRDPDNVSTHLFRKIVVFQMLRKERSAEWMLF